MSKQFYLFFSILFGITTLFLYQIPMDAAVLRKEKVKVSPSVINAHTVDQTQFAEYKKKIDAAKRTAEMITDAATRLHVLREISKEQIRAKDFSGAKQTIATAANGVYDRAQMLVEVAKAQILVANDRLAARITLQEAKKGVLEAIPQDTPKDAESFRAELFQDSIASLLLDIASTEARARDFTGAIETARAIPKGTREQMAFNTIVKEQALAGDLEGSRRSLQWITGDDDKAYRLRDIVAVYLKKKNIREAKRTAMLIENSAYDYSLVYMVQAFADIAKTQSAMNDMRGVRETLAYAQLVAESIQKPDYSRAGAFHSVANTYLSIGDFSSAKRIISMLPDAISWRYASEKIDIFLTSAKKQTEKGDQQGARESFASAVQTALTGTDHASQIRSLSDIVDAYNAVNDFVNARNTAELIPATSDVRSQTLDVVVTAQANSGDYRGAKQTAQLISNTDYKAEALVAIARAEAKAGHTDEAKATLQAAKRLAESTSQAYPKFKNLSLIEKEQRAIGDNAAADATVVAMPDGWGVKALTTTTGVTFTSLWDFFEDSDFDLGLPFRLDISLRLSSDVLTAIQEAKKKIAGGNIDDAERIAGIINDASAKTYVLAKVVEARVTIKDIDGAKRTTRMIAEDSIQSLLFSFIAGVQIEDGDISGAFETAKIIFNDRDRSSVLAAIANKQASAGRDILVKKEKK